jgi:hypothetical protein
LPSTAKKAFSALASASLSNFVSTRFSVPLIHYITHLCPRQVLCSISHCSFFPEWPSLTHAPHLN